MTAQVQVGVYIDYDNFVIAAQELNTQFSFRTTREYARRYGCICEAVVFLPPHALSERLVTVLCDTGFEVVACPMGYKDKDAVDSYLKARIRERSLWSTIKTFIVVSGDRDFAGDAQFVERIRDQHKTFVLLDPRKHKEHFQGAPDKENNRQDSRMRAAYAHVVDLFLTTSPPPENSIQRTLYDFIGEIMGVIYQVTITESGAYHNISALARAICVTLQQLPEKESEIRQIVTIFLERNLLIRRDERHGTRIIINLQHPSVQQTEELISP